MGNAGPLASPEVRLHSGYIPRVLEHSFIHVPGIGATRERRLWDEGYVDWPTFLSAHPRNAWRALIEANLDRELAARTLPRREQWRFMAVPFCCMSRSSRSSSSRSRSPVRFWSPPGTCSSVIWATWSGHLLRLWWFLSPGLYSLAALDELEIFRDNPALTTLANANPFAVLFTAYRIVIYGTPIRPTVPRISSPSASCSWPASRSSA